MPLTETTDYDNFDSEYYMKAYRWGSNGKLNGGDSLRFNLDAMHETFSSGVIKGKSLLDIGTGPTTKSLVTSCMYVDEMYLSDINQQNRGILTDWWKSDETLEPEMTDYILKKENASHSVDKRQNLMKKKIRGILPIDVRSENPLGKGDHPSQFDVITSWLCFGAAAQTAEAYCKVVQNVASLLKVGGHLIVMDFFNNEHYNVGNFKFLCASLSQDEIEHIFTICGFCIINITTKMIEADQESIMKEEKWSGKYALHAVKKA
ncbi:indolethylamine N-methyltransferase-like [Mizuhopecten yessoensis]|uniref:Indolethylamine N-methyltransferase n=1 Tax=Mizuhopecten yessoensis TaxID=6573 RepID=A0A210Q1I6_MIZYE|nr:indolethylamine N-methyltransferase-like [Mizuhopecten yessoensis]OWF42601.1 Indolethylamine N-methyltransferase [Mizuhopecten yessoensis]